MITAHIPTLAWAPPSPAMLIEPANLTIPRNFPAWVPPPPGVDPCWWPLPSPLGDSPQQAALCSLAEMLLFGGQSGGGKRLDLDTPLATSRGWTTVREVKVGDTLFDETGHPTQVTYISPIEIGDSYRLTFDDGSELVADREHRWFTATVAERYAQATRTEERKAHRRAKRPSRAIDNPRKPGVQASVTMLNRDRKYIYEEPPRGQIRNTLEILQTLRVKRDAANHSIRVAEALETSEIKLPLPPYTLGVWLGDGSHDSGRYTSEDAEIADYIRADGFKVVHHPSHKHSWGIWKWKTLAREHGLLFHKHIPAIYLRASKEQRLALLQGLMDTDGDCGLDGKAEFTSTNRELADGVYALALGLGLKATMREGRATLYGRDCGPKWRVSWTDSLQVFRLKRKSCRIKSKIRGCQRWRFIVSVEKVLDRPMRCIAVDSPTHLYLAGRQLIPTHNTDFLVGDAVQEYYIPTFRGLLLRESLGEMDQIADRLEKLCLSVGAQYKQRSGGGQWEFPIFDEQTRKAVRSKGGARIRFGYLAQDKDLGRYRGNLRSWVGIDESGLQPERRVRSILPWLAPTDPRLRGRMRLTSNPGGVGHGWQMAVFLRNKCPLHFPATERDNDPNSSVWSGRVYQGSSWKWPPSRAELVHMTTAFFPAAVTDNPLYGADKVNKLLSQTPEIQMQLLHGCWCNAASLYFGFMRPEWMVPYPSINDQWWWNHFISIDFGFGSSAAAAGRFSVDENGRIYGTGEIVERKMGAVDFAKKICETWLKPKMGEERPRYLFVCMDSAMDQHHDTGKSNFEQMAEVFQEYGLPAIYGHKNPADNAQVLYTGLSNFHIVLTTAMRKTFNSVQTRVIDDRHAVKKIHGDELDDLYDMLAYAYNTWVMESVKPDYLKLQDILEKMRSAGADATAIARRSLVEMAKLKKKEQTRAKGLPLRR